jgi:hypothetical protein
MPGKARNGWEQDGTYPGHELCKLGLHVEDLPHALGKVDLTDAIPGVARQVLVLHGRYP